LFGRILYSFGVIYEALLHCMARPTGSALHRIHCLLCTAWLCASTIAYSHRSHKSYIKLHGALHLSPSISPCPSRSANSGSKRQMNRTSPASSRVRRACLPARTPLRAECQNRRDGYAMSACFRDSLVKHGQLRGTRTTAISHVVGWCKSLVEGEGGGGEG
jgi:hypothetical protein